MIEIFVLLAILFLAKKPRRRRRAFALRGVRVTPQLALGTLGAGTAITTATTGAVVGTVRVISFKGVWSLTELTTGEGPITVGLAHSDYTVTEIKECLEASASIDAGNKIAAEQANRLVRIVGVLGENRVTLNNGNPISTRLNWKIAIGDQVNLFAYNDDDEALTTSGVVRFMGKVWIKDSV